MKSETSTYWLRCLEENNIPCGPINSIDQVFENPQIVARDILIEMTDSQGTKVKLPGNPIKLSNSVAEFNSAPTLGEHSAEILEDWLGMTEDQISELKEENII